MRIEINLRELFEKAQEINDLSNRVEMVLGSKIFSYEIQSRGETASQVQLTIEEYRKMGELMKTLIINTDILMNDIKKNFEDLDSAVARSF